MEGVCKGEKRKGGWDQKGEGVGVGHGGPGEIKIVLAIAFGCKTVAPLKLMYSALCLVHTTVHRLPKLLFPSGKYLEVTQFSCYRARFRTVARSVVSGPHSLMTTTSEDESDSDEESQVKSRRLS